MSQGSQCKDWYQYRLRECVCGKDGLIGVGIIGLGVVVLAGLFLYFGLNAHI